MDKTFSNLEAVKKAVFGAICVSNGDALYIDSDSDVEAVANEIWDATENGLNELSEVVDNEEFRHAKTLLGLENNVVRHIYKWDADYITSYIAFGADYDYCE